MKLTRLLRNLDRDLAVLSLFLLIALALAQIVARIVFSAPLIGAEELVRYFLICVVCFAAAYTARTSGHIKMEELLAFLPFTVRFALKVLALSTTILVVGVIAYSSIYTTLHNLRNTTATLSVPFWIFFMPNNIGFVLLTVEYFILLVRLLRGLEAARKADGTGSRDAMR